MNEVEEKAKLHGIEVGDIESHKNNIRRKLVVKLKNNKLKYKR